MSGRVVDAVRAMRRARGYDGPTFLARYAAAASALVAADLWQLRPA
jgi:hypothetical protein